MKKNINQKSNRLINENNPYLLQHAYNPVEWHPWGEEAFEKAEREDKPVFLSIGYSTCHWCHVMAHESFENKEVADLMNKAFINIKVDREERPDIDMVYMDVCQVLTGSGGWPLTIVMTPKKKPFFAGTYFPRESVFNRIGMKELIPKLSDMWKNRREDVVGSADELTNRIRSFSITSSDESLSEDIRDRAFESLFSSFDKEYGGFSSAPKFPIPHNLTYLLKYYAETRKPEALEMVEKTLNEMSKGGIYDHIGFGFHRYSTDSTWLSPHFEKMLYDQALIAIAYLEVWQATGNDFYKNKTDEILSYVERDMTSPEGGFYSAEDADSEGLEGKFYLWHAEELKKILKDDYDLFKTVYNVKDLGNFHDPAGHAPEQENILHIKKDVFELSEKLNIHKNELENKLSKIRQQLFDIREKRIHPQKDDKILTDWNGLMIAAFAKAGNVLNNEIYLNIAENAAEFIEQNMLDNDGRLLHRYNRGETAITGNLDDYAFYIYGLLELYEATFELKYLKQSLRLQEILFTNYWDNKSGGFYFTPDFGEELIVRKKDFYDGAVPSGNTVELMNLNRFFRITSDDKYSEYAEKQIKAFSGIVERMPVGYTQFLSGFDSAISHYTEIVLTAKSKEEIEPFLGVIRNYYLPNKVVIFRSEKNKTELAEIAEYTSNLEMINNKPTAYICSNYACEIPINETVEFRNRLDILFHDNTQDSF
ncbi:thioredoxin domain-containing protein [Bacteroidota bacterium]